MSPGLATIFNLFLAIDSPRHLMNLGAETRLLQKYMFIYMSMFVVTKVLAWLKFNALTYVQAKRGEKG